MGDTNEQEFVGSIPENYDRLLGPVLFADYAEEMARRTAALAPSRVLEVAAGTGIVSRALRDQLPAAAALTVTDLNAPMLEVAQQKFAAGEAVMFGTANALELPFEDGAFDVVVSQFGVMFYPDKEKAYREAFRVLAPGGWFLFSIWDAHRYNPLGGIGHAAVAGLFPDDPPGFLLVPFSTSFEDAKAPLLGAGFTELQAAVVPREKSGVDMTAIARGFVFGNPVVDQIRARGTVAPEAVAAKIEEGYRAAFGDSGRVPLQVTFIAARKPA